MQLDPLFRIVDVDAANACHVRTIFQSLYGEDFPVKDVYHPEVLSGEIRAGRLIAGLAFDAQERPVGYISLFKPAPNPRLWEAAGLAVVPGYSRTDLSSILVRYGLDIAARPMMDMDGIFCEAVCSHYFSQVILAKNGFTDCGFLLDELDGASFKDGKSNRAGSARVSCVFTFGETTAPSETEYIPARYEGMLHRIAATLRPRTLSPSTATLPAEGATILEDKYFSSARTWKLAVSRIGGDWPAVADRILSEARQRQAISLQVVLNMDCPCISAAVEILRDRGFFFGGMAPRWFGTDGLLMQQLFSSATEYEQIKVYTPMAKELLSFVRSDRETAKEN